MMANKPLRIPSLPASWPYASRTACLEWEHRQGVGLGSFGEGWNLVVPKDLVIPDQGDALAGAFGRGGVQRWGTLVLRPYRRGGLVRFLVASRYASPRRFEREWLMHRALWESGFPTVRPLGFGFRRAGIAFEGLYLSEFNEGRPWPTEWNAGLDRLTELRRCLDALADWGFWSPDLNATNVLIGPEGIRLLDWDRSAFVPDGNLLPLYRRRMLRSLRKLAAPESLIQAFLAVMKEGGADGR